MLQPVQKNAMNKLPRSPRNAPHSRIAKVEELLMKLDEQCQGDKLAEAGATMKDLEGVIGD